MSRDRSPSSPFFSSPSYSSEAFTLLPPQETSSCGSAAEEVVSLSADVRAAASKPASSSATALSARLAAAPPMPSSLAPAHGTECSPDELEERLRFYARQIKSFRRTSFMYSSPELMERIRQMERDYETAVRQFYCRPPPSTPGLQGAAAEQPTPGPQPDSRPETRRRGRRKRDAQAQLLFLVCRGSVRNWSSFWLLNPATRGLRRKRCRTLFMRGSRNSLSSFWPLNPETRVRQALLLPLRVRQAPCFWSSTEFLGGPLLCSIGLLTYLQFPVAGRHGLYASVGLHVFVGGLHGFAADRPELCGAGLVARRNSVPAGDDLLVACRNFIFVSAPLSTPVPQPQVIYDKP
ncbi:hypothetical protein AMECASPLE_021439 [Ameca splendens]|uniref:Uncharacterized protein n=1 Tax=Ameca splendens TaxID=208324 RepID=A0ABV0Z1K0_9TELE